MYMADLATDPRWMRVEGTFGEGADLAADIISEIVLGFQGDDLSSTSVALTIKHFPGGGATENGQDPHFEWGKREVFEANMFNNNLIPFKAAIKSGTSSIMPYYSLPVNTKYPELGYAFNKPVLTDLLRDELGFDGIINSDTGPIDMMPWGVETLSREKRYKLAIEAGVNLFSGGADPAYLITTLKKYPELMPLVDKSIYRLLLEKFKLGLFENPYVDAGQAEQVVGQAGFQAKADTALRKSIVLLRNENHGEGKLLPLAPKTKVYFEINLPSRGKEPVNVFEPETNAWDIELVGTPEEADVVVLWLMPQGRTLFESSPEPVHVNLSANKIDTDRINLLTEKKPTILLVNYSNPWAINEVYDVSRSNIKGVLATFGTTAEAVLDIVTGVFNPSGKMPFSTPLNDEKAQTQKSDLPGYMEEEGYALFHFDEGMSY